jgi:hypothetical protein
MKLMIFQFLVRSNAFSSMLIHILLVLKINVRFDSRFCSHRVLKISWFQVLNLDQITNFNTSHIPSNRASKSLGDFMVIWIKIELYYLQKIETNYYFTLLLIKNYYFTLLNKLSFSLKVT